MKNPWMPFAMCLLALPACDLGGPAQPALGTSSAQPLVVQVDGLNDLGIGGSQRSGDPVRLNVTSNSSDASYRTEWTVGAGTCLRVVQRDGGEVIHSGAPIVAHYYHFGRMLGVTVGAEGAQQLHSYVDPIRWSTVPCPDA